MRQRTLDPQTLLHGMFRTGLPWLLVAMLLLGNLMLSQHAAMLH